MGCIGFSLVLCVTVQLACGSERESDEYLIFNEEFNTFDLSVWKHEITLGGNGNREFQVYVNSRNNSYVKDGKLHLRATPLDEALGEDSVEHGTLDLWGTDKATTCTSPQFFGCYKQATGQDILPPVQSARVQTMESFAFKFGRVEIKAKLPKGDWLWPGIWLMAKENVYGGWPSSGELDIMESRGNGNEYTDEHGNPIGNNRFSTCFHFGPAWNKDGYPVAVNDTEPLPNNRSFGDEFHTFGLYWTDRELYSYMDSPDAVVTKITKYGKRSFWDIGLDAKAWQENDTYNVYPNTSIIAPFDQEMYIIMNVAVGGTSIAKGFLDSGYFPDDRGDKPWHTNDAFPAYNFYKQKQKWLKTWKLNEPKFVSDRSAMQIDSIKVWGIRNLTTYTNSRNDLIGVQNNFNSKIILDITKPDSEVKKSTRKNAEKLIFQDNFHQLDDLKWKHDVTFTGNKYVTFLNMLYNSRNVSFISNSKKLHILPQLTNQIFQLANNSDFDLNGIHHGDQCTSNYQSGCYLNDITNPNVLPPIVSASLKTSDSFSFRYGRVEMRAKLPKGDFLRPILRLMPKYNTYGEYPQSGEITIMQSRSNLNHNNRAISNNNNQNDTTTNTSSCLQQLNCDSFTSSFHFGPFNNDLASKHISAHTKYPVDDTLSTEFHTYGLYWDQNELYTYFDTPENIIDRVPFYGVKTSWAIGAEAKLWNGDDEDKISPWRTSGSNNAPFDQLMYLNVGLFVGGNDGYFPDNMVSKPYFDNDTKIEMYSKLNCNVSKWHRTWSSPFVVESINVWALDGISTWAYHGDLTAHEKIGSNTTASDTNKADRSVDGIGDGGNTCAELLIFEDSFNTLNMSKWKPEITMHGNGKKLNEFQMFVNHRMTSYVKNNTLFLKPALSELLLGKYTVEQGSIDLWGTDVPSKCTSAANNGCYHYPSAEDILKPIQSVQFRTAETFSFLYGRVEVVAQLPRGDWIVPSIRLIPRNKIFGMGQPGEFGDSIDMFTSRGNDPSYVYQNDSLGYNAVSSAVCTTESTNTNCEVIKIIATDANNKTFVDEYHTYGVYWDANEIITYLDHRDNVVGKFKISTKSMESLHQEMYIVLSVSIGGLASEEYFPHRWFPDSVSNKPWKNSDKYPHSEFYKKKYQWWPTWSTNNFENASILNSQTSDTAAFKLKNIKVWGFQPSVKDSSSNMKSKWRYHRFVGDPDITTDFVRETTTANYNEKQLSTSYQSAKLNDAKNVSTSSNLDNESNTVRPKKLNKTQEYLGVSTIVLSGIAFLLVCGVVFRYAIRTWNRRHYNAIPEMPAIRK